MSRFEHIEKPVSLRVLFAGVVVFFVVPAVLFAQEDSADQADYYPRIHIEDEVPNPVEIKKKRIPSNVFLGIKTRKRRIKSGYGKSKVAEHFRVLKEPADSLPPYVQAFYWYDKERRAVRQSAHYDPEKGPLLHGKYEKTRGEAVLQEGYFYKGTLHGRWEIHDKDGILLDKKKFHKGWPYDAIILYYDVERRKVRQVIPRHYGEKEGRYYAFYADGQLAANGRYQHGEKTDMWQEYYPNGREKRRIQYPRSPFDTEYTPVIVSEWDESGKLIYDRGSYLKSIQ